MSDPIPESVLADLRELDTPTVCNALEAVAPDRRNLGFTTIPLVCARPELPPIVGYARTATIAAMHPADYSREKGGELRNGYYQYIAEGGPQPSVTVIQDLDQQRGYGAWWGEVNSSVHKGLGSLGVVTDGSIRDLPDCAPGFQLIAGCVGPSHAHVHVVSFGGEVNVAGMTVQDGDLIHADQHGAVVIPIEVAAEVKAAADLIARREAVVIEAARQPGFSFEKLQQAWAGMAEIH